MRSGCGGGLVSLADDVVCAVAARRHLRVLTRHFERRPTEERWVELHAARLSHAHPLISPPPLALLQSARFGVRTTQFCARVTTKSARYVLQRVGAALRRTWLNTCCFAFGSRV
jgi:hypothetical protein